MAMYASWHQGLYALIALPVVVVIFVLIKSEELIQQTNDHQQQILKGSQKVSFFLGSLILTPGPSPWFFLAECSVCQRQGSREQWSECEVWATSAKGAKVTRGKRWAHHWRCRVSVKQARKQLTTSGAKLLPSPHAKMR